MKRPPLLIDVARQCNEVYDRAVASLGENLMGGSLLDLCADNIEDVSLADLKSAIVVAGIAARCNDRIRKQIVSYK